MRKRERNHRDEIAEMQRLDSEFTGEFEGDKDYQGETLARFKELLREDADKDGAFSDFANHGPWRAHLMSFLDALENRWEKALLNPADRSPGVSTEYLAGGTKVIRTIKEKIKRDDGRAHELELLRQAETEARSNGGT